MTVFYPASLLFDNTWVIISSATLFSASDANKRRYIAVFVCTAPHCTRHLPVCTAPDCTRHLPISTHFTCPCPNHGTHFQDTQYDRPVTGRYLILPLVMLLTPAISAGSCASLLKYSDVINVMSWKRPFRQSCCTASNSRAVTSANSYFTFGFIAVFQHWTDMCEVGLATACTCSVQALWITYWKVAPRLMYLVYFL